MAEEENVKLFVSGGCGPCEQVRQLISEGKHNLGKIDIIDLMTEENRHFIDELKLQKVPTAMKGEKTCNLLFDGESLLIDCADEMNPGEPDGDNPSNL